MLLGFYALSSIFLASSLIKILEVPHLGFEAEALVYPWSVHSYENAGSQFTRILDLSAPSFSQQKKNGFHIFLPSSQPYEPVFTTTHNQSYYKRLVESSSNQSCNVDAIKQLGVITMKLIYPKRTKGKIVINSTTTVPDSTALVSYEFNKGFNKELNKNKRFESSHNILVGFPNYNHMDRNAFAFNFSNGFFGYVHGHNRYLAPWDITQMVITYKLQTNISNGEITIRTGCATRFSAIYPTPDEIHMDQIVYTDDTKIREIKQSGLQIHAHFYENQYIQQIKVFLITTLLSICVTLFVKNLFSCISTWLTRILKLK